MVLMTSKEIKESRSIINVRLDDIKGVHPTAQTSVSATADFIYASAPNDYSELALHYLLNIHPIHVIKQDAELHVIAGFRSYELACLRLSEDAEITCILHVGIKSEEIPDIAVIDIAGSPIMHSLGPKFVQQLQNMVQTFGQQVLVNFPRLKSIRRIRGQTKSSS